MKQSEFNYLKIRDNFKIGFRGALSLVIAQIIDDNTVEGVDISTITYFEFKRRKWAYSMKGKNGSIDVFLSDLRPLFPVEESETAYFPFTITEVDGELSEPDIDEAEQILFERIIEGGYANYWADALPEDKKKMYVDGAWTEIVAV